MVWKLLELSSLQFEIYKLSITCGIIAHKTNLTYDLTLAQKLHFSSALNNQLISCSLMVIKEVCRPAADRIDMFLFLAAINRFIIWMFVSPNTSMTGNFVKLCFDIQLPRGRNSQSVYYTKFIVRLGAYAKGELSFDISVLANKTAKAPL